jgi:geranylgeranyl pyrophosphate synthase
MLSSLARSTQSNKLPGKTKPQSRLSCWQEIVDERLQTHVPPPEKTTELVRSAMHYAVEHGHRWRPILLICIYETISRRDYSEVLDSACAVELIHCCTIILDDLPFVDNASLRRGAPSCHVKYGEATTVYASHLLFALAERLCYGNATRITADEGLIRDHLYQLRERLIESQDLETNLNSHAIKAEEATLTKLYKLKSSPFLSSAWLAAVLANSEATERETLSRYGMYLGMAYQVNDDITDISGEPSEIGKPIGMDRGKVNFVTLLGLDVAKKMVQQLLSKANNMLDLLDYDTSALRELSSLIVKQQ